VCASISHGWAVPLGKEGGREGGREGRVVLGPDETLARGMGEAERESRMSHDSVLSLRSMWPCQSVRELTPPS